MVLVDGVKYACQACIKGHRSSKCTHTDRELTEIKKKGRPTSQCNHCRELRKTRSVHGKCECIGSREAREQTPVAKVLPNGLIDILKPNELPNDGLSQTARSGMNLLLNPCSCRSGGSCNCCQTVSKAKTKPFPDGPPSPLFVSSDLPTPPTPAPQASGGCCSMKRAPPTPLPLASHQPRASTSSSCCSSRTAPSPPYASSSHDIQVSPLPTPPPYTALSSSNPLFLPQTHGTLSCFCGPTCQCVGCATHDPFALKAKRKRSDSMEFDAEPIGCKCEVRPGDSELESARQGKKKKECCSSSASTSTSTRPEPFVEWPELNLSILPGGGGGETMLDPLPSLRTLLPALIDSASDSSCSPRPSRHDSLDAGLDGAVGPPSYLVSRDSGVGMAESPKIVCSSAFVKDVFDGDGECGEKCLCDTVCGCRVDPVEDAARETAPKSEKADAMGEIARLAEMGHFG
ncbi:hypothetical protein JCM11491_005829 [Sporobolomyces phaffii]